jgi:hypothetical protein
MSTGIPSALGLSACLACMYNRHKKRRSAALEVVDHEGKRNGSLAGAPGNGNDDHIHRVGQPGQRRLQPSDQQRGHTRGLNQQREIELSEDAWQQGAHIRASDEHHGIELPENIWHFRPVELPGRS